MDRFAERVSDYKAIVEQVGADDVALRVTAALAAVDGPVIADAVVRDLLADAPVTWCSDDDLSPTELDAAGAVVTTAAVGIANTGTIVLDHSAGQGRRAVSLVPDVHICLIRTDQIVTELEKAMAGGMDDTHRLQQVVRRTIGRWVSRSLRRRPMIVPVVVKI